jgi:hypothetical protein
MGIGSELGKRVAPRLHELAPGTVSFTVREALNRAINGVGPLPGAAAAAREQLAQAGGDVDAGIKEVIELHVRYAGAQGFVTNLGGLLTLAVALPTNVSGLALIKCRMVAGIAHLRGYDLEDPRIRNAILVTILGEDEVDKLIKKRQLPGPPMALATAPAYDPDLERVVAGHVASDLLTQIAGKRLATTVARRIPLLGGVIGMGADGYSTWKVGRYADRELRPRARR